MRSQPALRLFEIAASLRRALLGAAATALLTSCGGGGDNSPGTPSNGPIVGAPLDATACAGADLSALTSMVYVSALGADTDACGASSKNACATIAKGIAACADSGCGVLVRHGLYQTNATLDLRDGVNVHGSCRFDGEPNRRYRSTILAQPAAGTPAVRAASIAQPTMFSGFVVIGKDETAPSTASVAMAVTSSRGLTLTGMTIAAGAGGDAVAAASAQRPGAAGGDGGTGAAAVGAAGGLAGASCAPNPPADRRGFGGRGGTSAQGGNPFEDVCKQESEGPFGGESSVGVAGGAAGSAGMVGAFCNGFFGPGDGGAGSNGSPGACGRPGEASLLTAGSLISDSAGRVWAPSAGDDGQDGSVGSGGGGGGYGGYCAVVGVGNPDNVVTPGLPGGGGGGGGCGGALGKGGQQGGASLALVVVDSTVTLDAAHSAVVPGPGGRGGDAGKAAAGGPGGRGGGPQTEGKKLFSFFACGGSGGGGGAGGYGGAGSAGAAGDGGPSIGLAFSGSTPPPSSANGIYAPLPGAPGQGATGGAAAPVGGACQGAGGPAGQRGAGALAFQLDAALNPLSSVLLPGQQLLATGQVRTSSDGRSMLNAQGDGNVCLSVAGVPVWCSRQDLGLGPVQSVLMRSDGSLCFSTSLSSDPQCVPGTAPPWSYLQVRNDGHAVITDGAQVYWQAPP